MGMNERKIFSKNLCAFLLMQDFKYKSTGMDSENGKVYFIFDESPEIVEAINQYRIGEHRLHRFINSFRIVNSLIRETRRCLQEQGDVD